MAAPAAGGRQDLDPPGEIGLAIGRVRGLVVIPAYNEEQNLPRVLERLRSAQLTQDVVVVNDGSRDGTERVLRQLGQRHLRHPINLGYVRAVQTGIRYALQNDYDYVVFLDADGQHDPAAVPSLVRVLESGTADIVVGSRFVSDTGYRAPLGRRLGMKVFSWVTALLGRQRVFDTTSGFKAIARRAMPVLVEQTFGDFHSETLLLCMLLGLRVAEVPVQVAERRHGVSMYGPIDAVLYPLKTLVAILLVYALAGSLRHKLRLAGPVISGPGPTPAPLGDG